MVDSTNKLNIKINIDSIDLVQKKMINSYNDLIEMFNKYNEMIKSTEQVYVTNSGILYREVATIYVELMKKYMDKDIKEFIDSLDSVKKKYSDLINSINSLTNGENV